MAEFVHALEARVAVAMGGWLYAVHREQGEHKDAERFRCALFIRVGGDDHHEGG
jgi:hypothetical protein